mmetsp:Transcript_63478/g.174912  ORF Transcript_63478/g.174912 Transcript_63478/m.174912 type:complete len:265 (-) Transcript_63478:721-1515(-)
MKRTDFRQNSRRWIRLQAHWTMLWSTKVTPLILRIWPRLLTMYAKRRGQWSRTRQRARSCWKSTARRTLTTFVLRCRSLLRWLTALTISISRMNRGRHSDTTRTPICMGNRRKDTPERCIVIAVKQASGPPHPVGAPLPTKTPTSTQEAKLRLMPPVLQLQTGLVDRARRLLGELSSRRSRTRTAGVPSKAAWCRRRRVHDGARSETRVRSVRGVVSRQAHAVTAASCSTSRPSDRCASPPSSLATTPSATWKYGCARSHMRTV